MTVPFGVFVPQGWRLDLTRIADPVDQYEAMTTVAKVAEESGYDSIWVYDHFHTTPQPEKETTFECWMITAGLARDTSRIRIGQMVTCNGYRPPALMAKMASTADVMSQGRLIFGFGAGWYEHEWRAYGYGFPEVPQRMGMFREACEIIHRMFTEDEPVFNGRYYSIDKPINEPKCVQKPHPPFWIGGSGERVTLKLVAQWGDACNVGGSIETLKHKFEVLQRHCDDLGRDYDEITRSSNMFVYPIEPGADPVQATAAVRGDRSFEEFSKAFVVGTPEELIEFFEPRFAAGVNYQIVYIPGVAYDQDPVRLFAQEVIPHFS